MAVGPLFFGSPEALQRRDLEGEKLWSSNRFWIGFGDYFGPRAGQQRGRDRADGRREPGRRQLCPVGQYDRIDKARRPLQMELGKLLH